MAKTRTAREIIADALIPPEDFLLRAAYLLGKDEVLIRFLSNSSRSDESRCGRSAPVVRFEEGRGKTRTTREIIADALIPPEDFLLRAAYLLGKDEVLIRFLPNSSRSDEQSRRSSCPSCLRGETRTAREIIADAFIPPEDFLLRAAYLLGKDEVLIRFLPNSSRSDESRCGHSASVVRFEEFRQKKSRLAL